MAPHSGRKVDILPDVHGRAGEERPLRTIALHGTLVSRKQMRIVDGTLVMYLAPLRNGTRRSSAGRYAIEWTVSGDAELPTLPITGRPELLGRQQLGQIRRLVERPDLDPASPVSPG